MADNVSQATRSRTMAAVKSKDTTPELVVPRYVESFGLTVAEEVSKRSIAIACQGGGALSAFTAGALRSILRRLDPARFTIVGLSGTSGGAINALIAWYGLLIGDREKGARILLDFWNDDAATTPVDAITNFWVVEASRWASTGLVPAISPYDVPQVAKQYAAVGLGIALGVAGKSSEWAQYGRGVFELFDRRGNGLCGWRRADERALFVYG